MKKLYIVVNKIGDNKKYFANYINGELVEIGEFSLVINTGLVELKLKGKAVDKNSVYYFRKVGDKNLSIANIITNILVKNGIEVIDKSLLKVGRWEDKLTNSCLLAENGISIIPTIFSQNFEEVKNKFGIPFIAKEINTHRSQSVWVIRTREEFEKIVNEEDKRYIFQKLMNIKSEYRLLVTGENVLSVMVKDVRNYDNLKVGVPEGKPEEYLDLESIPKKYYEIAVASSKVLDLQVAGVDLMIEKETENPFIVEVNRGPGITLDTTLSPELPALKKYIDEIINK